MTTALTEITCCEVCGSQRLEPVLDLGRHPLCDDLVPLDDPRVCAEYPIEVLYCRTCRTAHQRFQLPKDLLFPDSYHYRARFTADVLSGMANLVAACRQRLGDLAGRRVLDIGCNDGSLLSIFGQHGATTIGIEPTDACLDARAAGHPVTQAFFQPDIAAEIAEQHGPFDIITMTNVFAHISDLPQLLAALRIVCGPRTTIVIENHYLGAILDSKQFDTFYHEHPRSYSYSSFAHIAGELGMAVGGVEFPARYGGNIRVFLTHPERGGLPPPPPVDESDFADRFAIMREQVHRWRESKARTIATLVARHGRLRAKAFPGRAAILTKLLGLDERSIAAVYEKPGSKKIAHYVPGTRIPLLSDDDLFAQADLSTPILNFAWHISGEIRAYLSQHGYTGPVIDIMDAQDFA